MATETEYRYLLPFMPDLGNVQPSHIIQGYLSRSFEHTRRIRIEKLPDGVTQAFETIKTPIAGTITVDEDEKEIPLEQAQALLEQCEGEFVEKHRYKVPAGNGLKWEVDAFKGKLSGLFIAEIEVPVEGTTYAIPAWMNGIDITRDKRFKNALLVDIEPDELQRNIASVLRP